MVALPSNRPVSRAQTQSTQRSPGASAKKLDTPVRREPAKPSPESRDRSEFIRQDRTGRTIVDLGRGDDRASIRQLEDGRLEITANGKSHLLDEKQSRHVTVRGGSGDDSIAIDGRVDADLKVAGGRGNDRLRGGDGGDQLYGGKGKDRVSGGGGNDRVSGGRGDDRVSGGAGDDWVAGGRGRDALRGGEGNDRMVGGAGKDRLRGGGGDDRLTGGNGRDVLAGGAGADRMDGQGGKDRLVREGEDQIKLGAGDRVQNGASRGPRLLDPAPAPRMRQLA